MYTGHVGEKLGSTLLQDAGMGELHTGLRHALSGADPETYFDHHVAPPGHLSNGESDCGYLSQYNQAYSDWAGLVSLGRLPT